MAFLPSSFRTRLVRGAVRVGVLVAMVIGGRPLALMAADAVDPVQTEVQLIARARQAAYRDDDAQADAHLRAVSGLAEKTVSSVALARRAAGVCGWLKSDGEYGRASKVASRAIRALSALKENTDAERAERLYWEAWLEGEVLDHRKQALTLLEAAEKLAPNDDRILEAEHRWAATLAEFGESSTAAEVVR